MQDKATISNKVKYSPSEVFPSKVDRIFSPETELLVSALLGTRPLVSIAILDSDYFKAALSSSDMLLLAGDI